MGQKESNRRWQQNNRDKTRAYCKAYYEQNKKRILEKTSERYYASKGTGKIKCPLLTKEEKQQKTREYNRAYAKLRRNNDPAPLQQWREKWQKHKEI
jgi:hypothetical protein